MRSAFRSVLSVNRTSLMGAVVVVALAATLLTATGVWLDAGIRDDKLAGVVELAGSFAGVVVMITIFIVASVFAGALRQRRREFALLRAIGATAQQIRTTVTAEVLAVLSIGAPVGVALGTLVAPLLIPLLRSGTALPAGFVLPFSPLAILATMLIMVPTALVAAWVAARGILRISPTAAVRESTVDSTVTSGGRRKTAAGFGIAGLAAASTPFFVPGVLGSAAGATSAILLVVAAALAGPALVQQIAIKGIALNDHSPGSGRVLAFANARGFSRRLSAAVIPLALLLALGSVQSGVNSALTRATANELHAGVHADLIATSQLGVTSTQAATIAALSGVTATTAAGHLSAAVRTDTDIGWEQATINTITPGQPLLDVAVSSGSLNDLDRVGTIAVSRDALLFTGKGLGDTIDVRPTAGSATVAKIVAIYGRGLGFGQYITRADSNNTASFDAIFVNATAASQIGTRSALVDMGLAVTDNAGYARDAAQDAGDQQQLSLLMLLALLGFVAVAAANTLATSTASRRDEFALLTRIGATRAQVMRMVAIETLIIIAASLAIGILAVLPALVGVGYGLLGVPLPAFDLPVTSGLAISIVLIAVVTVIPAAWRATSTSSSRNESSRLANADR